MIFLNVSVNLYSTKENEITKFLNKFYNNKEKIIENKTWFKEYTNPIEMADIIGVFIDNNDKFQINMWICLDEGFLLNVTEHNADKIIRYLFERYPY